MKKSILFLIISICFSNFYAQENTNFNFHQRHYIFGDACTIGNSILGKYKSKPLNNLSTINDLVNMRYIDVDNNSSTFSSSSATLNIPDNATKIVSATLYWSAIYSYEKGGKKQKRNRLIYTKENSSRSNNFNTIKLKTPQGNYLDITGKILFDGYNNPNFPDSAPYVCYADVTDKLNINQINGEYTIANVKATQGFISGGSSAGWLLYIVYKAPTKRPNFLASYHGLIHVTDNQSLTVDITDFQTPSQGNVNAGLTIGALEGDLTLKHDKFEILKQSNNKFIALEGKDRKHRNFFNSKIITFNSAFKSRKPKSTNNLGFDLAEIEIPNTNNSIINNNSTKTTLRFSTKADRFQLFFTAFKIESDRDFHEIKVLEEQKAKDTNEIVEVVKPQNNKLLKPQEVTENNQEEVSTETPKPVVSLKDEIINNLVRRESVYIPNVPSGYYVVTNVFSKLYYADRWERFLESKYYPVVHFINPKNNWHYMTVYNSIDPYQAYKVREKLDRLDYFKDLWVFKVNINDHNQLQF